MSELLAKVKAAKAELFDGYTKLDEAGLTALAIRIGVLPDPAVAGIVVGDERDRVIGELREAMARAELRIATLVATLAEYQSTESVPPEIPPEDRLTDEEMELMGLVDDLSQAAESNPDAARMLAGIMDSLRAIASGDFRPSPTRKERAIYALMEALAEAVGKDPALEARADALLTELGAIAAGEPEQPSEGPRYPVPDGAWLNPENGYPALLRCTKSGVCDAGKRFSFRAGARLRGEKAWALWDHYNASVVALSKDGRDVR